MTAWPAKSQQDLVDAGFKFRGFVPCPACGGNIAIWQKPDLFPVFLDPETFWPHLDRFKHADPPEVDHKMAAAGEK